MPSKQLSEAKNCIRILQLQQQDFDQITFLKSLSIVSSNPNNEYRRSSLYIFSLYCIICKYDYVQALEAIEKSESVSQQLILVARKNSNSLNNAKDLTQIESMIKVLSISVGKMIRALLYTYIDKQRQGLLILKEVFTMLKGLTTLSNEIKRGNNHHQYQYHYLVQIKNHYKQMIPVIIKNLNFQSGRKSFMEFLDKCYDQLAKQSNVSEGNSEGDAFSYQINEQILYSLHGRLQQLRDRMDCLGVKNNNIKRQMTNLHSSKNASISKSKSKVITHKLKSSRQSNASDSDDYGGFMKRPTNNKQKAIQNIYKMADDKSSNSKLQKSRSQPYIRPNKSITKGLFQQKGTKLPKLQNPYQLNLYVDQSSKCQFM